MRSDFAGKNLQHKDQANNCHSCGDINNAAVSYVAYIWQMFWPARLAAFYPHPNDQLPFWQVLLAIAFLISVSLLAIFREKNNLEFSPAGFGMSGCSCL